jgi:hypothetical protein
MGELGRGGGRDGYERIIRGKIKRHRCNVKREIMMEKREIRYVKSMSWDLLFRNKLAISYKCG